MTEQPVETEQQFLGNDSGIPIIPLQHYAPNAHRFRQPIAEPEGPAEAAEKGPTDLQLEAEVHTGHALRSLENGELNAGIAWLQSALAFAQNARHVLETAPAVITFGEPALPYQGEMVRP